MKKPIIHYDPRLKQLARELRSHSTLAEVLLWNELKRGRLLGCDFHRQKPVDRYIVDFYCPELSLVVEIDGTSHLGREERDAARQDRLEQLGLRVLRFDDLDVKFQMQRVLDSIREWIMEHAAAAGAANTPGGSAP